MTAGLQQPHATPGLDAIRLSGLLRTFFNLSTALSLSCPEERALLDVPAAEVVTLREGLPPATGLDVVKLERRLNYAIPILQRMMAAMSY